MKKVVSVEEMRRLERDADARGLPGPALMENAGRAVSDVCVIRYPPSRGRQVLVLVGPGNNGGDGLVVARHLSDNGFKVVTYLINRPMVDDAKLDLLRQRGVSLDNQSSDPELATLALRLESAAVVVDAILGTGRARPVTGVLAEILDRVNARPSKSRLIAVDLPTGVNADTGEVDPHALNADLTITLAEPKRGLVLGDAVNKVGELVVVDIGIPDIFALPISISFPDRHDISPLLPVRLASGNKGTFGRVLAVVGSELYTGAPVLVAKGAERVGAGLVTIGCPATVRANLAAHTLESTFLPLPDSGAGRFGPESLAPIRGVLQDYVGFVVGPGLGRSPETAEFLIGLLGDLRSLDRPVVLDADALTLLSQHEQWWKLLPARTVMTPHPGEMARLIGGAMPRDRIGTAVDSAKAWSTNLVLKGAYSVVARPDGSAFVLPFANSALATAGTGDVLAGTILGLLAQGLSPADAALTGAFAHGTAGALLRARFGPAGGLASDLADLLPNALNVIKQPDS
ncbi:MAG TPA: NAD(P)H-hydrate dehydratase [Chloroflexota bacterium]|nr:NAD(P)H-hydrate dehydratase [Chloroflexota bacterium]